LLAGDELDAPDRPLVRRHLLGCPSCRRRFEELQAALHVLHLAAAESPVAADSPSIWPELSRQIRESRRPAPRRTLSFSWSWSWAGSALALAAGLLFAFLVHVPRPGPTPTRPPAPTPIAVVPASTPAARPVRHEPPPVQFRPKPAAPPEVIVKARGRSKKDTLAAETRPSPRGDADADRTAVAEQPTH
jgi:anti-sigma factor RsiW